MRSRNRQRGFSLLELLIVVMLMIIIAAMATPALIGAIRRYQLESTGRQIKNMIMTARYEAIRRNRPICTVLQVVGGESHYGMDLPRPGDPDSTPCNNAPSLAPGDPFVFTPSATLWYDTGTAQPPPTYNGLPAGYTNTSTPPPVAPGDYRITFSPRGVVINPATGLMVPEVQMFAVHRDIPGQFDAILITITPMGKIKLFRWDIAGNRWQDMR
jgi:prepilin-type N-terminal cleavage/methylation domain-containing protein